MLLDTPGAIRYALLWDNGPVILFGSVGLLLAVSVLTAAKVAEKDATPETLAAARVSAVSEDKIEHQTRWRCKRPFS